MQQKQARDEAALAALASWGRRRLGESDSKNVLKRRSAGELVSLRVCDSQLWRFWVPRAAREHPDPASSRFSPRCCWNGRLDTPLGIARQQCRCRQVRTRRSFRHDDAPSLPRTRRARRARARQGGPPPLAASAASSAPPSYPRPTAPTAHPRSGTTIMAVAFDGGVVLGADSRTSTGAFGHRLLRLARAARALHEPSPPGRRRASTSVILSAAPPPARPSRVPLPPSRRLVRREPRVG